MASDWYEVQVHREVDGRRHEEVQQVAGFDLSRELVALTEGTPGKILGMTVKWTGRH